MGTVTVHMVDTAMTPTRGMEMEDTGKHMGLVVLSLSMSVSWLPQSIRAAAEVCFLFSLFCVDPFSSTIFCDRHPAVIDTPPFVLPLICTPPFGSALG